VRFALHRTERLLLHVAAIVAWLSRLVLWNEHVPVMVVYKAAVAFLAVARVSMTANSIEIVASTGIQRAMVSTVPSAAMMHCA